MFSSMFNITVCCCLVVVVINGAVKIQSPSPALHLFDVIRGSKLIARKSPNTIRLGKLRRSTDEILYIIVTMLAPAAAEVYGSSMRQIFTKSNKSLIEPNVAL
uniref:Uncharacterized protein n=1 Tax=Schizaphis graminum TaxID=13262 RepID=A0A2S2P3L4_SCHGA